MATSILCASKISLLKRWNTTLKFFRTYIAKNKSELLEFLHNHKAPIVLIIEKYLFEKEDEKFLQNLRDNFPFVKICVLSNKPNIKEAQNFIKLGIKGYGNSYMYKTHLQDMVEAVWSGDFWFYPEFIEVFFPQNKLNAFRKTQAIIKEISHLAIIRDAQEERIAQINESINENETLITPYKDSYVSLNIDDKNSIELDGVSALYFEKSVFVKSSFKDISTLNIQKVNTVLEALGEKPFKIANQEKSEKNKQAYYKGYLKEYVIKPSQSFSGYWIIKDSVSKRDGSDLIDKEVEYLVFKDTTKSFKDICTLSEYAPNTFS